MQLYGFLETVDWHIYIMPFLIDTLLFLTPTMYKSFVKREVAQNTL